ncbi:DUF5998 family protein [Leekyejoonella antrihumi]|uniref:Phosphodiesterase n=1 Tax=Leekyejoonella antrihumi TaxID=1660198 RepID=A0A563E340_9MICO|nr:DUF5998 family protein [Leekyejoonella antrihumi]TWP36946.1 phosphodiesterase [Leekyejoonella antrihumi]
MASTRPHTEAVLPAALIADIEQAGYFPELVTDVVTTALGDDPVDAHLVHAETTLDTETVRRHITVLVLTAGRLLIAHADDHAPSPDSPTEHLGPIATATSETVPLSAVRGVMLTHVVPAPEEYRAGSLGREITVTIGWGTVSRVDLLPATCGDPQCEADHGYEGTITADDIALRVSADADGQSVFDRAREFATALSGAIGR